MNQSDGKHPEVKCWTVYGADTETTQGPLLVETAWRRSLQYA
jgi:hypothetical protein